MRTRIITVTLNAAVDKTYVNIQLQLRKVNRIDQVLTCAGGKGINVARVLATLGAEVMTMGFIGGHNGEFIKEDLTKRGIETAFTTVEGESRLCLSFLGSGQATEVLEPGPVVLEEELIRLEHRLHGEAKKADLVVLSGSLPRGLDAAVYARLIEVCRPTRVILDTSGEALRAALPAKPFLLKPNWTELEQLAGSTLSSRVEVQTIADRIAALNGINILVSLGRDGAWLCSEEEVNFPAYPVTVINPVGCGDALVAGTAFGIVNGKSLRDAVQLGMACAAENARHEQAGQVDRQGIEELLGFTIG